MGPEEVPGPIDLLQRPPRHRQGTTAGKGHFLAFSLGHQRNHGVLNDLRPHLEPRNIRMRAHRLQHRVGRLTHAPDWIGRKGFGTTPRRISAARKFATFSPMRPVVSSMSRNEPV